MSKLTFKYDVSFSGKTVLDKDMILAAMAEGVRGVDPSTLKGLELATYNLIQEGDLEGLIQLTIKQQMRDVIGGVLKRTMDTNDAEESVKFSPIAIKFKPHAEEA